MKKILMMISCCFFLFCLFSCGLDTFYYLDPPISLHFIDEADSPSQDPNKHYVSFMTVSAGENEEVFQGTAVYYKIYNSNSTLLSDKASIENINSDNTNQGMNRLINWGYQALTTSTSNTVNLVPSDSGIMVVEIRLFNETPTASGEYDYPALVQADGKSLGVPLRYFGNKTFSFNTNASDDSVDSVPREGDGDVRFTTSASTSTWYVALYAVSTGMSPSLTPIYSQLTYLGSLAITPASN